MHRSGFRCLEHSLKPVLPGSTHLSCVFHFPFQPTGIRLTRRTRKMILVFLAVVFGRTRITSGRSRYFVFSRMELIEIMLTNDHFEFVMKFRIFNRIRQGIVFFFYLRQAIYCFVN